MPGGLLFAIGKTVELGRMPVARKHHLLACRAEVLDQDSESLLRSYATFQQLHVIQQQDIAIFILFLECHGEFADIPYLILQGLAHGRRVTQEIVSVTIDDTRMSPGLLNLSGHRLQQVRLSEPRLAIDKQRVQRRITRIFGNGLASLASGKVAITLDKVFESVTRIQRKLAANHLLELRLLDHARNDRENGSSLRSQRLFFRFHDTNTVTHIFRAQHLRQGLVQNVAVMGTNPVFTQLVGNGDLHVSVKKAFVIGRIQDGEAKIVVTFLAKEVKHALPNRDCLETGERFNQRNSVCHNLPMI